MHRDGEGPGGIARERRIVVEHDAGSILLSRPDSAARKRGIAVETGGVEIGRRLVVEAEQRGDHQLLAEFLVPSDLHRLGEDPPIVMVETVADVGAPPDRLDVVGESHHRDLAELVPWPALGSVHVHVGRVVEADRVAVREVHALVGVGQETIGVAESDVERDVGVRTEQLVHPDEHIGGTLVLPILLEQAFDPVEVVRGSEVERRVALVEIDGLVERDPVRLVVALGAVGETWRRRGPAGLEIGPDAPGMPLVLQRDPRHLRIAGGRRSACRRRSGDRVVDELPLHRDAGIERRLEIGRLRVDLHPTGILAIALVPVGDDVLGTPAHLLDELQHRRQRERHDPETPRARPLRSLRRADPVGRDGHRGRVRLHHHGSGHRSLLAGNMPGGATVTYNTFHPMLQLSGTPARIRLQGGTCTARCNVDLLRLV